jgi:hypothetical protein
MTTLKHENIYNTRRIQLINGMIVIYASALSTAVTTAVGITDTLVH